jgi:hypothetical protein
LFATPPSMYMRPSISTGGKIPGIAAEASIGSRIRPEENTRSFPVSRSVVVTRRGACASSKRASRPMVRSIMPRSPVLSKTRLPFTSMRAHDALKRPPGNRSSLRRLRQFHSRSTTPL